MMANILVLSGGTSVTHGVFWGSQLRQIVFRVPALRESCPRSPLVCGGVSLVLLSGSLSLRPYTVLRRSLR